MLEKVEFKFRCDACGNEAVNDSLFLLRPSLNDLRERVNKMDRTEFIPRGWVFINSEHWQENGYVTKNLVIDSLTFCSLGCLHKYTGELLENNGDARKCGIRKKS